MGIVVAVVAGVKAVASAVAGVLGFTAVGVATGSVAAGVQSVVYGAAVTTGGLFAGAQSLAMTGAAVL